MTSSDTPLLSVVICTHNPRGDYFRETLTSLLEQDLPRKLWELIIVDNASTSDIPALEMVHSHQRGRIVRETRLGLTYARIRGIHESVGTAIVFVDDDNALSSNYLSTALILLEKNPTVGVWSAGYIKGRFEMTPPRSWSAFLPALTLTDCAYEETSDSPFSGVLPQGAGMVVRKSLAEAYAAQLLADPVRRSLGRKGNSLAASEDTDLGLTICDAGFRCGRSPKLLLAHLIAARRTSKYYLIKINREVCRSHRLLYQRRGLMRINIFRLLLRLVFSITAVPFRFFIHGSGNALFPLVVITGEYLAYCDWKKITEFQKSG